MWLVEITAMPSEQLANKIVDLLDTGVLDGEVVINCYDPVKASFVAAVFCHFAFTVKWIAIVDRRSPSEAVVIHAHESNVSVGQRIAVPSGAVTVTL